LLCIRVHSFKVSARPLKGLDGPLLSVGFPQASLEKYSAGLQVSGNPAFPGGKILRFPDGAADVSGYPAWQESFRQPEGTASGERSAPFNSLPVYGAVYRLAVEVTEMASRLPRNYRYSLGEDIRQGAKRALLCVTLAGKGEERPAHIRKARLSAMDVQLSLRLLSDLHVLEDKRYVYFLEMTEEIVKQLSNWERGVRRRESTAGVPSP
ncbi:MAG: four helix bundle protein, partial [Bacteroidales bacterium]|nr:four helix bundle protein [Bacteroidales bacterium]